MSLPTIIKNFSLFMVVFVCVLRSYGQCTSTSGDCCSGANFTVTASSFSYAATSVTAQITFELKVAAPCFLHAITDGVLGTGDGVTGVHLVPTSSTAATPFVTTFTATHVYTVADVCSTHTFELGACLLYTGEPGNVTCYKTATLSIPAYTSTLTVAATMTSCNTAYLTSNGPAQDGQWLFGDGSDYPHVPSGNPGNVYHAYATPGIYTATLTGKNILCPLTTTLQVIPPPTGDFTYTTSVSYTPCVNGNVTLSIASPGAGNTYSWMINTTPSWAGVPTGVYASGFYPNTNTVSLLISNGLCTTTITKTLTVPPYQYLMPSDFTYSLTTSCTPGIPSSIDLGILNYSTSPTVYGWSVNGTTFTPGGSLSTTSVGLHPVVNVIALSTISGSCNVAVTKTVIIGSPDSYTISAINTGCKTFSFSYASTAGIPALASPQWAFGDGVLSSTTGVSASCIHTYPGPGSYVLSLSGVGIDPCQTQTVVNVSDFMTPDFSYSVVNLCSAASGASLIIPAYNSAYAYAWQINNFIVPAAGATGLYTAHFQNGANIIKLTVTNASGCSTSVTKVFNIGAPLASFNTVYDNCIGDQLSVYNVSPGGGSYQWTLTPTAGGTPAGLAGMNPAYTFTAANQYAVALLITTTITAAGITSVCVNSGAAYVNVSPVPDATFTMSAVSCNNSMSLTPVSAQPMEQYTIDYGDGTGNSGIGPAVYPAHLSHTYTPGVSYTIYPVTLTFKNGNCISEQTQNVAIHNNSSLTVLAPTYYICRHNPVPLTALVNSNVGGAGPYAYHWAGPSAYTSSLSSASATEQGVYSVTATSTGGCAMTLTANISMTDLASPTASIAPGEIQHMDCSHPWGTATLTINSDLASQGFIINGDSIPAGPINPTQYIVSNLVAGTNYITIANLLSPACFTTIPVLITHSTDPVISVDVTQPQSCPGNGSADVTITNGTGYLEWYALEDYPNTPFSYSGGTSLAPGSYVVKHTYGFCQAIAHFNVVAPVISLTHTSGAGACPGTTTPVTLTPVCSPTLGGGAFSYSLYKIEATAAVFVPGTAPYDLQAGAYRADVTAGNGCTASHNFVIQALDSIKTMLTVNGPDCVNSGTVSALPYGGDGNYTYKWYWNGLLNASTASSLAFTALSATASVSVTVTDGSGCTTTFPETARIISPYVPVNLKDCSHTDGTNAGADNNHSTQVTSCDITTCLQGGQGLYNYEWFKLDAPQTTLEWKFRYDSLGVFVASPGDGSPEVIVAIPASAPIDLSANADHADTSVTYPYWDFTSGTALPVMTSAGQLLTTATASNDPANYYTVMESVTVPARETFITSYHNNGNYYASRDGFTSGDYNLHVIDDKGCRSTFSITGLTFSDSSSLHLPFTFVWGMNRKDVEPVVTDPILHENMIEAAGELLEKSNTCLANETSKLIKSMDVSCSDVSGLDDALNLAYKLQESHHTLYYYDRAGRLTKTVPPQGVEYLPAAGIAAVKSFRKNGDVAEPHGIVPHRMATTYQYNSFGQLIRQATPDGGTTVFIYDSKNRLRFSQNDKQKLSSRYSYTKYDPLGRIVEVGESALFSDTPGTLDFTSLTAAGNTPLANSPVFPTSLTRQVTTTHYSEASPVTYYGKPQRYTQNRVSYTTLDEDPATPNNEHDTYYSYDTHGNVEWLVQDDPAGMGKNYLAYDYDLVSGKVLKVAYNENRKDRFYHRYAYDAENRLKKAETSRNGQIWDTDAGYTYYPHGPLKRNVIGEDHVQGLDYIYTLNGWIKSVNAPRLNRRNDPGKDNNIFATGNPIERTAADRFGMVLNYYNGDYLRAAADTGNYLSASANNYNMPAYNVPASDAPSLYNGNISSWVHSQLDATATGVITARADLFKYDLLNRIKQSTSVAENAPGAGWAALADSAYKTTYSYDANGNILTLKRFANNGLMDDLAYNYSGTAGAGAVNKNTLMSVSDATSSVVSGRQDLQATHAYTYDAIGNLTRQTGQEVLSLTGTAALYNVTTNIEWTVYGKIKQILKTTMNGSIPLNERITFEYDASGNRVKKEYWKDDVAGHNNTEEQEEITTTWYVRDAQGNPMATYQRYFDGNSPGHPFKIDLIEQPIYGAERIGENVQRVTLASSPDFNTLGLPSNGFGTISEYQNWITTTSKTQLLPGGTTNDQLCQCKVVSLNGTHYNMASDAAELLGIAGNGVAVAEDLNRSLQFFVVLAKNYLGTSHDACLVFDRDGHLMQGTDLVTSVDPNSKPIIVNLPGTKQYALVTLDALQQPVYHVIDMDLQGYNPLSTYKAGKVISANNALAVNATGVTHGLHFTGTEDHVAGHAIVYGTRYTPDANINGQGTTHIIAYDFGASALTPPTAHTLHTVFGCATTQSGQLQISPDGSKLAWWHITRQLAGFTAHNGEIITLPLNNSRTALNGAITSKPIRSAGSFGNGMFDFMANSADVLFSQRGVYNDNSGPVKYDRNVWKYTPLNLSSLNPNLANPMISYLFGEIKRGTDGNYYMPQMGAARDQIHAYSGTGFNTNVTAGDTAFKLASSLPTQVYKIFATQSQDLRECVRSVGNKDYELKDHLGNVRVVISDAKILALTGPGTNFSHDIEVFPEVKNYTDYYPFGSLMPGRQFNAGNYRYLFQSKEQDNEIKGTGNSYDFDARINDPRLGRWLSIDPWANKYPWQSPYASMDNNPIWLIDPTGMGAEDWVKGKDGKIKWDEKATSQETTQDGETYLGKNVVEFIGSRNEKLGTQAGKEGYINADDAVTADLTVYGPDGPDDMQYFKGYTMSSDAIRFGAIDEGLYDANYDAKGKSGALKSNWTVNKRGHVRMMDGKVNPNAPSQLEGNGEGYKDGIFIHTSNNSGFAGAFTGGAISTGCLLIVPKDWQMFNSAMNGVKNFKVQVTRDAPALVPLEGVNGPIEGRGTIRFMPKTD